MLDEALESDVADVLLLPQLIENVVFTIRKAAHAKRAIPSTTRAPTRPRDHRVLAEGRHRQDGDRVEPRVVAGPPRQRKTLLLDLDLQFGDAAIVMGVEPEKTIYDLVVAPGELDIEKLAGYTARAPVRSRHPPRAAAARRTPSS